LSAFLSYEERANMALSVSLIAMVMIIFVIPILDDIRDELKHIACALENKNKDN
jgi:hypothetical protein